MKTRNKIIICLLIIGVSLFGFVQGVVIPHRNQQEKQYIVNQQNPITHDLDSVLQYKNKYMGNFSNIANLFYNLPLNNVKISFELFPDKLTAEVNYQETVEDSNENKVNMALIYNSTAAFALIDNLQGINYNFTGSTYKVMRSDVEKWYGEDLAELLNKDEWKVKVQDKLQENNFVEDCIKSYERK